MGFFRYENNTSIPFFTVKYVVVITSTTMVNFVGGRYYCSIALIQALSYNSIYTAFEQ